MAASCLGPRRGAAIPQRRLWRDDQSQPLARVLLLVEAVGKSRRGAISLSKSTSPLSAPRPNRPSEVLAAGERCPAGGRSVPAHRTLRDSYKGRVFSRQPPSKAVAMVSVLGEEIAV